MDRFEEVKLRIKEATDLVALIESYLPLKARGRDLLALCPFHAERSPSFTVNRPGQFFYCFGCGKTGDVFTWMMEREGLTFREAMETLADRAGITLEGVFQNQRPKAAPGPDPYQALGEVAGFFSRCLGSDQGMLAREYLTARGLTEAIHPWRLGVHPSPGALAKFAADKRLPLSVLEQAGLLRGEGRTREPYAYRLMFPIEDERGRVVGFGGRLLPGAPGSEGDGEFKPPKYLNSPESPWFNKRRVLFGLGKVKQAAARRLIVTEGYTDVIACHLAGFPGAVASLGTAFTQDHARMVERYASEGVVLMFDGDRAGKQAAERAMRELINSRLTVRVAMVGDGDATAKDPADLLTQRPGDDEELVAVRRENFRGMLEHADEQLAVWFRLLRQRRDLQDPAQLEAAARECAELLALCAEPVRRDALLAGMARHLAVPQAHLERLLAKRPAVQRAAGPRAAGDGEAEAAVPATGSNRQVQRSLEQQAELDLLACVLAQPRLGQELDFAQEPPFTLQGILPLLERAQQAIAAGCTESRGLLSDLFSRFAEDLATRRLLGEGAARAATLNQPEALFAGLRTGRRRRQDEPRLRNLRQAMQQALAQGDLAGAALLQQQLLEGKRGLVLPQAQPPAQAGGILPSG